MQVGNIRSIVYPLAKEASRLLNIYAPKQQAHMRTVLNLEHMREARLFMNLPFTNIHIFSDFSSCFNPATDMEPNSASVAFFFSNVRERCFLAFPLLKRKIRIESGHAILFNPFYTRFGLITREEESNAK